MKNPMETINRSPSPDSVENKDPMENTLALENLQKGMDFLNTRWITGSSGKEAYREQYDKIHENEKTRFIKDGIAAVITRRLDIVEITGSLSFQKSDSTWVNNIFVIDKDSNYSFNSEIITKKEKGFGQGASPYHDKKNIEETFKSYKKIIDIQKKEDGIVDIKVEYNDSTEDTLSLKLDSHISDEDMNLVNDAKSVMEEKRSEEERHPGN